MTTRAFGVEAEFGDLELSAKVYIEREAQRLGLENDNDLVSYVFTAAYDLKPHRFGFDVAYFRDRFSGADTQAVGCDRARHRVYGAEERQCVD